MRTETAADRHHLLFQRVDVVDGGGCGIPAVASHPTNHVAHFTHTASGQGCLQHHTPTRVSEQSLPQERPLLQSLASTLKPL